MKTGICPVCKIRIGVSRNKIPKLSGHGKDDEERESYYYALQVHAVSAPLEGFSRSTPCSGSMSWPKDRTVVE